MALDDDTAQVQAAPIGATKKKAVIVAGGSVVPKADISIVVEARTYGKPDADGAISISVKLDKYPSGADTYLRYDPAVTFPTDAPEILTMGENIQQNNFWGFTMQPGHLNVGPAHPAYAGANLAAQRGAIDIEIIGLTDAEKEKLRPFFDELSTNAVEPAQVTVSLT